MSMDLYHRDLGFPLGFQPPTGQIPVRYGAHASNAAKNDRYGRIRLPRVIDASIFEVIEIGVKDGDVVKMLFRGPLDERRDLCIVLMPSARFWFCKTVWANLVTDNHKTIDYRRYVSPNQR